MGKKIKVGKIKGVVEWFDNTRGFGYLITTEGIRVFVYYADLPIKDGDFIVLRQNQNVYFEIFQGPRGPQAKNIEII